MHDQLKEQKPWTGLVHLFSGVGVDTLWHSREIWLTCDYYQVTKLLIKLHAHTNGISA